MQPTKQTALTLIVVGFIFSATAFVLNGFFGDVSPRLAQSFAYGISMGHAILLIGSIQLARAKGRPWYYGLLGFLSCVGVAVLWFAVPDKRAAA